MFPERRVRAASGHETGAPVSGDHAKRIEHAFTRQAEAFEDARFNRPFAAGMEWIFEPLRLTPDDVLLDVASGTGQAARFLAPSVRSVIALDATEAMLFRGRAEARRSGLRNVVFQRGDAAQLPFLDGAFDVVVCRFAAHHFEDPAVQVTEMTRCLRPGGRLALADLVADPDPKIASEQNRLERLRDPSHARLLSQEELVALVVDAGLEVEAVVAREREWPLEPWLAQTGASVAVATDIRARLSFELAGGPATGLRPREADGELHFKQTFVSVLAASTSQGRTSRLAPATCVAPAQRVAPRCCRDMTTWSNLTKES